jgi:hypothetical protein
MSTHSCSPHYSQFSLNRTQLNSSNIYIISPPGRQQNLIIASEANPTAAACAVPSSQMIIIQFFSIAASAFLQCVALETAKNYEIILFALRMIDF